MRPIYETKDDKIRQQFVADAVAEYWQITCVPEPELEENDYRLLKGDKFFAIMEVKFRHGYTWTEMRFMDTYILSLEKWFALWRKCAEHNVALCLAISDKAGEIWAATVARQASGLRGAQWRAPRPQRPKGHREAGSHPNGRHQRIDQRQR